MINFSAPNLSMPTLSAPALQLQQKALTMFMAVPQVMATRIWKIAAAPMDSKMQQKEIQSMVSEKQTAFMQSLADINSQIVASQMTLANQWMSDWQRLISGNHNAFNNFGTHIDNEATKIMDKGLSPYAKTVKANQTRLSN